MKPINDSTIDSAAAPAAEAEFAFVRFESPVGRLELTANAGGEIVAVTLESDGRLPHDGQPERATTSLRAAARQLQEYFAGTRTLFTVRLATPDGTEFQRRVWQRIADIPFGEHATYGQIALDVGKPGAGRAVGAAVAANTQPLLIGCHRVLGVSGHITGYSQGQGTVTKQWLLNHEGTAHRPVSDSQYQPRLLATTSSTTSSSSPAAP
ncbi:methylated-DNA--[protein]-cysteine S-methyltransferase [Leifsonia sp. A12D58]|uniref:methylated-DNA--[protein]-cysteine S-methyltransferase n=1 Tax=Leifsonia sp. A12D58 TaxID=3397674 RepID=UPI0039E11759